MVYLHCVALVQWHASADTNATSDDMIHVNADMVYQKNIVMRVVDGMSNQQYDSYNVECALQVQGLLRADMCGANRHLPILIGDV